MERFEKVLLADPDVVYHSFYVGSGAVRFYLPLNQQLENANFAQAVVVTTQLRGARRRCARAWRKCCEDDFDTLMARVEPLALGPPVDWPLQYRVSGPDIDRRARHRRRPWRRRMRAQRQYARRQLRLERDDQVDAHRGRPGQGAAARRQLRAGVARVARRALSGRTVTQFRDDIYLIDVQGRAQARDRGDVSRPARPGDRPGRRATPCRSRRSRTFDYGLEETDDLAPRPAAHDHGAGRRSPMGCRPPR